MKTKNNHPCLFPSLSTEEPPFRVTDLKQWIYCPRILYFLYCLPDVRPTTYKMEVGSRAGYKEVRREIRRGLRIYGLDTGRREFDRWVSSPLLGLRGKVDMVIWCDDLQSKECIPVDYKLSRKMGKHFKLQLVAYGVMLEEESGYSSQRGFLYSILERRVHEVRFTTRLKAEFQRVVVSMREMLFTERMPAHTPRKARCVSCEFRRFCNDVF